MSLTVLTFRNALTKIINDEMKDKNVIVNSMCPVRHTSLSTLNYC